MTDVQMLQLAGQLARISQQATPNAAYAAHALMIGAIMINRTFKLPDELTKQMFDDLIDGTGDDAPVRVLN